MTKNKEVLFKDLKLEQIVLELRYPVAFLLTSAAGSLWNEIEKKLPEKPFVIEEFQSSKITGTYDNKFQISIENERLMVSAFFPNSSLSDYLDVLRIIFNLTVEKLDLQTLNRIGLRQIYIKKFESLKKSVEASLTLPCFQFSEKYKSAYKDSFVIPAMSLRIDDDKKGKLFSINTIERGFSVDYPLNFVSEEKKSKTHTIQDSVLIFDVDFYTKGVVNVGQIDIDEWVKQVHNSVIKDSKMFFEESYELR